MLRSYLSIGISKKQKMCRLDQWLRLWYTKYKVHSSYPCVQSNKYTHICVTGCKSPLRSLDSQKNPELHIFYQIYSSGQSTSVNKRYLIAKIPHTWCFMEINSNSAHIVQVKDGSGRAGGSVEKRWNSGRGQCHKMCSMAPCSMYALL